MCSYSLVGRREGVDMVNEVKNEIVLFDSEDGSLSLPVSIEADTVCFSQAQMAKLFGKDRTVIGRHIRNAIKVVKLRQKWMVQFRDYRR